MDGVRRWGRGAQVRAQSAGCKRRRPRPARPDRCRPPAPTRGEPPRRGALLTDGLVAQHGVEGAHLHLGAPHHRLLGRAGGSLPRALSPAAPPPHPSASPMAPPPSDEPRARRAATSSAQAHSRRGRALDSGLALRTLPRRRRRRS